MSQPISLPLTRGALSAAMLALFAAPALARGPGVGCDGPDAPVKAVVDSARHAVVITLGPCRVPALGALDMPGMSMAGMNMPGMNMPDMDTPGAPAMHQMDMGMEHGPGHEDVRVHFRWPADVWMRGFDLRLYDANHHRLDQPTTMHHFELLDFDRRQLVYPLVERVFGMGEETSSALVPKTVGLPLDRGMDMALYVMWNNHTDQPLDGVTFELTIRYSPRNLSPRPTIVLPFKADVNIHPGFGDAFDLPPGGGSRAALFTVGTSGRLLAVGGHLHDYGKELRLEDAATGHVLARVEAERRPDGTVTGVTHGLYGVLGRGPHLIAGHQYRLVAVYEGSPADSIKGAMGVMGGIFAPDHYRRWPAIDRHNPDYLIDLNPPGPRAISQAGPQ
ncbi:MAG TPA: hypothetical protein VJQ46_07810 [Gemmatimonadales bacterium]|nr:hypothetical protein [Gemmatimonadales bacterium]